jgi:uncharacterized membrane protein
MNLRINQLDALRGFAVILMVQQHLISWLWEVRWVSYSLTFPEYPVMMILNFFGNFAAPLFLLLSGTGAFLLFEKTEIRKFEFLKRGLFIISSGYLLNILSPHWFSPGSWYILHTIGIGIILAPFFIRLRILYLLVLSLSVIAAAPLIMTFLNTPLNMGNNFMNDIARTGGIIRLAAAEGHFPLFPWTGFFITGIICGKWIKKERFLNILMLSGFSLAAGIFLAFCYKYGFFFATGGTFFRFFVFTPFIYPSHISFILMLLAISLLILLLFYRILYRRDFLPFSLFNAVGRLSLTWFFVHIILFNEIFRAAGFHGNLTAWKAIITSALFMIIMLFLSLKWQKYNYFMSLEWVMRKVVKSKK